ncbi:MAG: hypothetical protein OXG87_13255 [Gemmatimonadetes bacterium]|nr:hypothetical protein [Gemmatimonadota bacterium]
MIRLIISDLSEVLVSGLYGIEIELQPILGIPQDEILSGFSGNLLTTLFVGRITEDEYLSEIISEKCWPVTVEGLRETIRRNLLRSDNRAIALVTSLAEKMDVVILSDHAREWGDFVRQNHPFLKVFERQFYSYETGITKSGPRAFTHVLRTMRVAAEESLFIDDRMPNVETALSVGLNTHHYTTVETLESYLVSRGILG